MLYRQLSNPADLDVIVIKQGERERQWDANRVWPETILPYYIHGSWTEDSSTEAKLLLAHCIMYFTVLVPFSCHIPPVVDDIVVGESHYQLGTCTRSAIEHSFVDAGTV